MVSNVARFRSLDASFSVAAFYIADAMGEGWCPGQDSNLHALRHTPLKRVCLPIPPPGQFQTEEGALRGIGFAL